MQSPPISDPPCVKREMQHFEMEQKAINKRRLDLLEQLRYSDIFAGHLEK